MSKIVIVTTKDWNIEQAQRLQKRYKNTWIISAPNQLTLKALRKWKPDYVFFPHWSWKISERIFTEFECVAFHMTDLPFGRGGSPLQNLISRGFKKTKISALKVVKELDAGPIYAK